MARQLNSASSQYLELASAIVSAAPMTVAIWFKPASASVTYNLFTVGDAGGANYFNVYLNPTGTSATVGATAQQNGTVERTATTTTTFSANRWHHACAVYASATSRSAYLNGGGKGSDVNSSAPVSLSQTDLGGFHVGGSVFSPFNGQVAEVAIWNVDLSDAEVALIAGVGGAPVAGLPLLVRPSNLVAYWPLRGEASPEVNFAPTGFAKNIAAVNAPVVVPQPDFLLPEPPRRPRFAAASVGAGSSSFAMAATLGGITLSSSFAPSAPAASALTFAPTVANVALSSSFAAASPGSSALAFSPTLAAVALTSSFTATATGNSLLTGLVAYLPLDETSGNALDSVGSFNWTDHGSVGTATGKVGTARTFDGSTQWLERPDTFGIGATSGAPFTIAGWVWVGSLSANQVLMGRYDGTRLLQLWTGSAGFWVNYGVSPFNMVGTGAGSITAGTWYHLAFTFSATGTGKIYLNGSLAATDTTPTGDFSSPGTTMALGRRGDGDSPFAGRIDELGLWGRELSATDVSAHYNGGSGLALASFGGAATAYFTVSASLGPVALSASLTAASPPSSSATVAPTLAAVALSASLATTAPAATSAALAPTLAAVALASTFTASAAGVSSITLAPTLAAATLSATLVSTAPAASSFSAAATLAGVTLAASLATTAPGSSSITCTPTLAAVSLTSSFTAAAPSSSSITLTPTLAAVALSSSFTTAAPSSSSFSASATLANVALTSSFAANTVGSVSFSTSPTLAPVALASTLATTTPAASSFSAAASLAAVTLASTFTAGASGGSTFAVAGTVPVSLAATLAATRPAASAIAYAATLANVSFSALLTASGPGSTSATLAATLANCTASLHLIASGGPTGPVRVTTFRSTGRRMGVDPSKSTGARLGVDGRSSRGQAT